MWGGCAVVAVVAVCVLAKAGAHRVGEEFTYLSMFLKPSRGRGFSSEERAALSSQYYRRGTWYEGGPRAPARRLQGEEIVQAVRADASDGMDDEGLVDSAVDGKTGDGAEAGEESREALLPPRRDAALRKAVASAAATATAGKGAEVKGAALQVVRTQSVEGEEEEEAAAAAGGAEAESATEERRQDFDGENVERLSMMLGKIIAQYDIHSMADVPCRAHAHWMADLVRRVRARRPRFKYYCVDTNRAILQAVRRRMGAVDAQFVQRRFWRHALPRADLVFSWAGLDNMRTQNVERYVRMLGGGRGGHKLVLLGSHSGRLQRDGSPDRVYRFTMGGAPINFRKGPFFLTRPMRIVGDLCRGGNDKQLYIYRPKEMLAKG